jgi:hypothetical protein
MTPAKKFVVVARETPFYKHGKIVTAINGAGINAFHLAGANNSYVDTNKKWTMMAVAATIQASSRSTPKAAVVVGTMEQPLTGGGAAQDFYNPQGSLAGAPTPLLVSSASFASSLESAAALPANSLKPVGPADYVRYGFTGSTPPKLAEFRDNLITAAKALGAGATTNISIAYGGDDPHDLFTVNGPHGLGLNAATAAAFYGNALNAFEDDLMAVDDPKCPGRKLGDNTVIVFIGDTPKTGTLSTNFNDPSTGGQNVAYVISNGTLKTGFFGGERPRTAGDTSGAVNDQLAPGPGEGGLWDSLTGDMIPWDGTGSTGSIGGTTTARRQAGEAAMASVLYAIARGNLTTVNTYYSGPAFPALVKPVATIPE